MERPGSASDGTEREREREREKREPLGVADRHTYTEREERTEIPKVVLCHTVCDVIEPTNRQVTGIVRQWRKGKLVEGMTAFSRQKTRNFGNLWI